MTMAMDPRVYDASADIKNEVSQAKEAVAAGQAEFSTGDPLAEARARQIAEAVSFGKLAYISPVHKNTKFLIRSGKSTLCVQGSDVPAMAGMNQPTEVRRIGDVFIQFSQGICILDPDNDPDDLVRLDWAIQHEDICRNAMDPMVDTWLSMKEGQLNLSTREPSLDPSLDVDAVMRGDFSGFSTTGSLAARARAIIGGV